MILRIKGFLGINNSRSPTWIQADADKNSATLSMEAADYRNVDISGGTAMKRTGGVRLDTSGYGTTAVLGLFELVRSDREEYTLVCNGGTLRSEVST